MEELVDLRPLRHPAVEWRSIEGAVILLVPGEPGAQEELNPVASRIWELCDGRRSVREIAAAIVGEFDVEPATAEQDAAGFVREMLEGSLLLPGNGAAERA